MFDRLFYLSGRNDILKGKLEGFRFFIILWVEGFYCDWVIYNDMWMVWWNGKLGKEVFFFIFV